MKILIASTKELCYFSGSFFLDRIQETLERKNVEIVRLDFDENEADYSLLEGEIGKTYDAVLDINSRLPYLIDETGSRILNQIDAPFINYILDHPLYHHPGLCFPIHRQFCLGIDKYHAAYMKRFYPHVVSVGYLPMAGTKALEELPFDKRKNEILFTGTYLPDEELDEKILALRNQINDATYQLAMDLWDAWQDTTRPIEDCLMELLQGYCGSRKLSDVEKYIQDHYKISGFAELLNHMFLVDQKKRNQKRERVLSAVSKGSIPLTVVGEGWEHSSISENANIRFLPARPMASTLLLMGRYRFVLDSNPLFACGLHDRVTSAMINGAVCLTDMSPKFDEELRDGERLMFYDERYVDALLFRLENLPEEAAEQIAKEGRKLAERKYSWDAHGDALIRFIEYIS